MEQLASDIAGSPLRRTMPDRQPDLTIIENNSSLHDGGIFLPQNELEDLNIPTTKYRGNEVIGGAKVDFTIEVPDDVLDPTPVVFAHGYFGFQLAYSALRNATARNGKIAITYNPPRTQKDFSGLTEKHLLHPERLLSQALWGVMRGTMKMSDEIGHSVDVFDTNGHSMGGPTATDNAINHPDYVRTVILNESAGLDNDRLGVKLGQVPAFLKDELGPAIVNREFKSDNDFLVAVQLANYLLRNPLKTFFEGVMVGNCDARDKVSQLGGLGIKSALIVASSDRLVSAEKTLKYSKHIPDIAATYRDPRFNHLAPQIHPLTVANVQRELLRQLHASKKSRNKSTR